MKPHPHAEFIRAYADGKTIQFRKYPQDNWEDAQADDDTAPAFSKNYEYRIKPEPPKYPQTKMTDMELDQAWESGEIRSGRAAVFCAHRTLANAVIARAIEDGDVVPAEALKNVTFDVRVTPNGVRTFVGGEEWVPETMLEQVAKAFRSAALERISSCTMYRPTYQAVELIDINAIIEAVKKGK